MSFVSTDKFNPNPITKLITVFLLGFTVIHTINDYFAWLITGVLALLFYLNNYRKEALKGVLFYAILFLLPKVSFIYKLPLLLKMIVSILIVAKMFYLPYMAGKLLIQTSDVGSIISSMDKIKIPEALSIPIAVMFRFFPSFMEEKKHLKQAMVIRGLSVKNPFCYLKYVTIPLLIISSNIADDIAKAAEAKCIENPIKKTRYKEVNFGVIDFVYLGIIILAVILGRL